MDSSLADLSYYSFGFNLSTLSTLEKRFEIFKKFNFDSYKSFNLNFLILFLTKIIPTHSDLKKKYTLNIFFLDVISSYRGWRHSKGLPVRGQRTWSNAWSPYRSNLTLRLFKLNLARKLYGNVPASEINLAYLAEEINVLWKLQWNEEWKVAKKKRLHIQKKSRIPYKIDLYAMSQGQLNTAGKSKKASKSSKKLSDNKSLTLGFDVGFTKMILKETSKSKLSRAKPSKISGASDKVQNIKKKKTAKPQQSIAKKKKKSLWE
jgi:hypothetical protein